MRKVSLGIAVMLIAMFVASCGENVNNQKSSMPDWVSKGTGVYTGDKGKVFRGVGSSTNIQDYSMARSAAETKARSAIAQIFNTYIAKLTKIYESSTQSGDKSQSESDFTNVQKEFTKAHMSGIQISQIWPDPMAYMDQPANKKMIFALAELDLGLFKDFANQYGQMSQQMKDMVKANADKAFDDLSAEENK